MGLPKSFAPGSEAQLAAGHLLANTRGELTRANVELVARAADQLTDPHALVRVIKSLPAVSVRVNFNRVQLTRARALLNGILHSYPDKAETLLSSLLIDSTNETVLSLPLAQQTTVFSRGAAIAELEANGPLAVVAARSVALKHDDIFDSPLSMFNPLHGGGFSHRQIVEALRCLKPGDDATHFLSADEIHNFVAFEARHFEASNSFFKAVISSPQTRPETLLSCLQSSLAEFRQDVTAAVLSHPNLDPAIANGEWEALFYGKRPSLLMAMNKEQRLAASGHPKLDIHWRRNFVKTHNWDAARHVALDDELVALIDTDVLASHARDADRRDTKVFEALAKAHRLTFRDWQDIVNGSSLARTWAATTALSTYNSVGLTLPVTERVDATSRVLSSHPLSRHEFDEVNVWSDFPGISAVPMKIPRKVMRDMEMHFDDVFVRVLPSAWDMHKFSPESGHLDWVFNADRAASSDSHYVMALVSKGSDDYLVTWRTNNDSEFQAHLSFDAKTAEMLEPVPGWLQETSAYVSSQWSRPEQFLALDLGA